MDTTGAGDGFCGALAVALAERRPLAEAVRRGCAAGALAATRIGAQSALPTGAELDAFLADGRRALRCADRDCGTRDWPALVAGLRHYETLVSPTPGCRCRTTSRRSIWSGPAASRRCCRCSPRSPAELVLEDAYLAEELTDPVLLEGLDAQLGDDPAEADQPRRPQGPLPQGHSASCGPARRRRTPT